MNNSISICALGQQYRQCAHQLQKRLDELKARRKTAAPEEFITIDRRIEQIYHELLETRKTANLLEQYYEKETEPCRARLV